jgi:Tfp pilus assembly pilus retraction ATPase PilT
MYNMLMSSKIIKKLLDYAKQHEITDLAITQKNGNHVLWGETGSIKHQLRLPAKLESELSSAYRRLLSLAPTDLVSGVYFKDKDSAFKISIIPDENGEKIIINTVAKTHKVMPLSHLGLGRNERKIIENFLRRRRGLIVIGSDDNQGKTTTIYSLLQKNR